MSAAVCIQMLKVNKMILPAGCPMCPPYECIVLGEL